MSRFRWLNVRKLPGPFDPSLSGSLSFLARLFLVGAMGGQLGFLYGATPSSGIVHYQGRLLAGTSVFEGTGQFKFAFVNGTGSQTYWRNSTDANGNGEPDAAVNVPVTRGLYGIDLGDSSIPNMALIPPSLFADRINGLAADPTFLRVWFND